MTGKEWLGAIQEIDDELIEEAAECDQSPAKKRSLGKWAIAAAIVLACMTSISVAAATTELGAKIKQFFSDPWESGYDLELSIERVPSSVFDGEVTELAATFHQQYVNYKPYMSTMPGYYRQEFRSSQEVLTYLGWEQFRYPAWTPEEEKVVLTLYGESDGTLKSVSMEVQYEVEEVRIQVIANVFTEKWMGSLDTGVRTPQYETYTEERFETQSGKLCLVITSSKNQNGYYVKTGWLVENNVSYHFHAAYRAGREQQAEKLLKEWLKLW